MNHRILICIESFSIGGAEKQALNLAKGLFDKGFYVKLMAVGSKGESKEQFKYKGVELKYLPLKLYETHKQALRQNGSLIRKEIKTSKITHVVPFTYWPNLQLNYAVSKIIFRRPKVYWNQRDIGINFGKASIEKETIQKSTEIIGNSRQCINAVFSHLNSSNLKSRVITNGVDVSSFGAPLQINRLPMNAIMLANITRLKDHETLIKAWKIIRDNNRIELPNLFFAGDKRDNYDYLMTLVTNYGLEKNIIFLGKVKNVKSLLEKMNFAVFSSYKEGSPNGLLECMKMGLPCVASKIGSIEEALTTNYRFLVEPGSPNEFAEKIELLLLDSDEFKRVGNFCQLRIEENYSHQKMIDGYIELFND